MNEQSIIREYLTFTGRVQGVGFRYRAKHAADSVGAVSYTHLNDIEGIIEKLESGRYVVSYVTELMELEGGQELVRFYDPSGNLIEVRTPINYI